MRGECSKSEVGCGGGDVVGSLCVVEDVDQRRVSDRDPEPDSRETEALAKGLGNTQVGIVGD